MLPPTLNLTDLHPSCKAGNDTSLTKNNNTLCQASKLAFFMPKIHQAWLNLTALTPNSSIKTKSLFSQYGRVKARIKDLAIGNKCKCVIAFSDITCN